MRLALPALAAAALLALDVGCTSEPPSTESNSAAVSTPTDLDIGAVTRGLVAPPKSAERVAAADAMKQVMDVVTKQIAPRKDVADEQKFTAGMMGYTIDYLRTGQACAPSQKVRLFRGVGHGAQPLVRKTVESKSGVVYTKPVMDAMRKLPVPSPSGEGMAALNGVPQFDLLVTKSTPLPMRIDTDPAAAAALNKLIDDTSAKTERFTSANKAEHVSKLKDAIRTSDIGFSYHFGFGRTVENRDADDGVKLPVELAFSRIGLDHTQGAAWEDGAGAAFSPLISTTIHNTFEKFGPLFIVADVCPERAIINSAPFFAPHEGEVYMPMFMLPEEIVDVVTDANALLAIPLPSASERPLDATYRACFGQGVEVISAAGDAYHAAMKSAVARKASLEDFRTEVAKALQKACAPESSATSCPAAPSGGKCVASSFCKSKGLAKEAVQVNGLPCVVEGAGGCQPCN